MLPGTSKAPVPSPDKHWRTKLDGEVSHTSLLLEPEDVGQGFAGLGCPGLTGHV